MTRLELNLVPERGPQAAWPLPLDGLPTIRPSELHSWGGFSFGSNRCALKDPAQVRSAVFRHP